MKTNRLIIPINPYHVFWFRTTPSPSFHFAVRWGRMAWFATCCGRTRRITSLGGTRWTRACRTPMAPMWWMSSWRRITWTGPDTPKWHVSNLSLRHLRPKEIGKTWLNMRNGVLLFSCCKAGEHSLIVRVRFDKMAEGPEFFEFIMSLTLLLDASLLFPDWLDILKTPPRVNQPS